MVGDRHMHIQEPNAAITTAVLQVLNYFHIFRHALYAGEVYDFLRIKVDRLELEGVLEYLVSNEKVYCSQNLYALENTESIFLKRLHGSEKATQKMRTAYKSARIISAFPFVKCICISGSLSKGYADEKSDIDFFIITTHNRLWICRTALHVFKKLTFLAGKQHSFCMNYFIDEGRQELDEKNLFTATEVATLIPMYNIEAYCSFMHENESLVSSFFPNKELQSPQENKTVKRGLFRPLSEWLLNHMWPQKVNGFLMYLTDVKWRRKWQKRNFPMDEYDIAMKTRWYVSKQHPLNYQKKVLSSQMPVTKEKFAVNI